MRRKFEEGELEELMDSISEGICRVHMDEDFTLIYGNAGFYQIYGYTREEMRVEIGNRLIALIDKRDIATVRNTIMQAYEEKREDFVFEKRARRRDGKRIWIRTKGILQKENGDIWYNCVIRDITKEKQMEQQAEENRERMRIISQNLGSPVCEYSLDSRKFTHQEADFEENNSTPQEMVEKGIVHPDSAEYFYDMCRRIDMGAEKMQCTIQLRNQDGSYGWKKLQMARATGLDFGRRAVGIFEDVSEQKKLEFDLMQMRIAKEKALKTQGSLRVDNKIPAKAEILPECGTEEQVEAGNTCRSRKGNPSVEKEQATDMEISLLHYQNAVKNAKDDETIARAALEMLSEYFDPQGIGVMHRDQQDKYLRMEALKIDGEIIECRSKKNFENQWNFFDRMAAMKSEITVDDIEQLKFTDSQLYTELQQRNIRCMYGFFWRKSPVEIYLFIAFNPKKHLGNYKAKELMKATICGDMERVRDRNLLIRLKHIDPVTGVSNRVGYNEYMNQVCANDLDSVGVLLVNVGGLRKLNRTYGDMYGDDVLKENAGILLSYFTERRVFRVGQDKFLAICENISYEAWQLKVQEIRRRLHDGKSSEVFVGERWCDIDIDIHELLAQAEECMLIERNKYYQEGNALEMGYRLELLQSVRQDIKENRYKLYLQPKVDIKTREIIGAESLVRRENKNKEIETPDKFIPLLEKAYLIRFVDLFIFEEVCKMLAQWKKKGKKLIPIALNFSRITLLEYDLITIILEITKKYEIETHYIEIELTETVGEVEKEKLHTMSRLLKENGFKVALDDFGTKYTNLSVVSTIEFDVLKLDRSLINSLSDSFNNKVIVHSVIDMCRQLNVETVAEGIETEEQCRELEKMGCTYGQGYLFSKPMPQEDFEKMR